MPEKEKTKRILRGECWHEIVEIILPGGSRGTKCIHCSSQEISGVKGQPWGWYCHDSPDHRCHYYSKIDENKNRFVWSVNREKIILQDHDSKRETLGYCLFCGQSRFKTHSTR